MVPYLLFLIHWNYKWIIVIHLYEQLINQILNQYVHDFLIHPLLLLLDIVDLHWRT